MPPCSSTQETLIGQLQWLQTSHSPSCWPLWPPPPLWLGSAPAGSHALLSTVAWGWVGLAARMAQSPCGLHTRAAETFVGMGQILLQVCLPSCCMPGPRLPCYATTEAWTASVLLHQYPQQFALMHAYATCMPETGLVASSSFSEAAAHIKGRPIRC